jgi:toxin HigB-1
MIGSFRDKRLRRLAEDDDATGIRPDLVRKVRAILTALDYAHTIEDLRFQTRLHPLTGDLKGYWSITVSRNWRIIFRFDDGRAWDIEFVDYH